MVQSADLPIPKLKVAGNSTGNTVLKLKEKKFHLVSSPGANGETQKKLMLTTPR